jgi:hypothetical protein
VTPSSAVPSLNADPACQAIRSIYLRVDNYPDAR